MRTIRWVLLAVVATCVLALAAACGDSGGGATVDMGAYEYHP